MAKDTKEMENKSLLGDVEEGPVTATTPAGAKRAAEAKPALKKAQEDRRKELAQSGYSIPEEWFALEAESIKHDEAIAKAMPSTQAQEHKP